MKIEIMYIIVKLVSSAVLITLISEIAKRSSFWGAFLASLPFISIFAFIFMYIENKDTVAVANLSHDIFWLVIPSLALFIVFPILLNRGMEFFMSLGISCLITIAIYFVMGYALRQMGILEI